MCCLQESQVHCEKFVEDFYNIVPGFGMMMSKRHNIMIYDLLSHMYILYFALVWFLRRGICNTDDQHKVRNTFHLSGLDGKRLELLRSLSCGAGWGVYFDLLGSNRVDFKK